MLLTRDNLIRFLKEKGVLTPSQVSEEFKTSTIIASATLSELIKRKEAEITNLKIGSSPFYYDPLQREKLVSIGEKYFNGTEKEVFDKLIKFEIINESNLTLQERMVVKSMTDFAICIEIEFKEKTYKFWIWYLRNISETKKHILEAFKQKDKQRKVEEEKSIKPQQNIISNYEKQSNSYSPIKRDIGESRINEINVTEKIENFLSNLNLTVIEKTKNKDDLYYKVESKIGKIRIIFECKFFDKKIIEKDIIDFYISSISPKIIFVKVVTKKIEKLIANFENLTLIHIQ